MTDFKLFDFDSHYYEALDAFTRHVDPALGSRGARFEVVDGRTRFMVGGEINRYIANPTFDPVARPGALHSWYRGNPERKSLRDAFGDLEPIRPEYRNRDRRLEVMDEQGVGATLLFPTLGVGLEEALKGDPEAAGKVFSGFNLWLAGGLGISLPGPHLRCTHRPPARSQFAHDELARLLDRGTLVVNIRNAPVPLPGGGFRSPFDPLYDASGDRPPRAASWWRPMRGSRGTTSSSTCGRTARRTPYSAHPCGGSSQRVGPSPTSTAPPFASSFSSAFPPSAWPASRTVPRGPRPAPPSRRRRQSQPWVLQDGALGRSSRTIFGSPHSGRTTSAALSEVVAVDQMLLGSDWPHAEGVVQPVDFVNDALGWADESTKRRIGRENAERLLGVQIP